MTKTYRVTPTHLTHGYTEPTIYVTVPEKTDVKEVIREAMERSGLSRFDEWSFGF